MAKITYNGVSLPFPFHTNFVQGAVYDEVGETDKMYTRFDITVEALLNTDYNSATDGSVAAASTPAAMMNSIRSKLLTPRKTLKVEVNGTDIIPRSTTNIDARNGPHPQSCDITMITNTTFLIRYHIIADYVEPSSSTPSNGIVSIRWKEQVFINSRNFTVRTREGRYVIRSDQGAGIFEADDYREDMAVLSCPPGFRRESAFYEVSEDGLRINFRVIDREVFRQPTIPALEAEGTYTETATHNGAVRKGKCKVTLKGAKDTNQGKLIETTIQMCLGKIRSMGSVLTLDNFYVSVEMWDNSATCEADVMFAAFSTKQLRLDKGGAAKRAAVVASISNLLAKHPDADDPTPPPHPSRGTAGLFLKAAAYFDPAVSVALNKENNQLTGDVTPVGTGT